MKMNSVYFILFKDGDLEIFFEKPSKKEWQEHYKDDALISLTSLQPNLGFPQVSTLKEALNFCKCLYGLDSPHAIIALAKVLSSDIETTQIRKDSRILRALLNDKQFTALDALLSYSRRSTNLPATIQLLHTVLKEKRREK